MFPPRHLEDVDPNWAWGAFGGALEGLDLQLCLWWNGVQFNVQAVQAVVAGELYGLEVRTSAGHA